MVSACPRGTIENSPIIYYWDYERMKNDVKSCKIEIANQFFIDPIISIRPWRDSDRRSDFLFPGMQSLGYYLTSLRDFFLQK
jgi:hypothetical protein